MLNFYKMIALKYFLSTDKIDKTPLSLDICDDTTINI